MGDHSYYDQESSQQKPELAGIMKYKLWNNISGENDIALMYLADDLEWTDAVKPICLPQEDVTPNTTCVTIGWGSTKCKVIDIK